MNYDLPNSKIFKPLKPSHSGGIQTLLKHGACSLMRDWTILIEAEFSLETDCRNCRTELPINIGLTKHWIVVASQQRYFTGKQADQDINFNKYPQCNKSVQISGIILSLEQLLPRKFIKMTTEEDKILVLEMMLKKR